MPGCKDQAGGPILPECSFVNPLQGIAAAARASDAWADDVLYEQGCDIDSNDTSGVAAAVAAAALADYTIFIGGLITCQEIGEECQEAEARDRSSVLPPRGTQLETCCAPSSPLPSASSLSPSPLFPLSPPFAFRSPRPDLPSP